ncbi:hypothetical protein K7432_012127 [Basidiobolus ranarum]|uniref:Uncharacterized protein n=1 Tax=Basidiobolus ranarum TaxID=34480 RepID=A0ABR2VSS4_9FUNG
MESGKLEEVLASDYQDPDPRASSTLDVPPTITVTPVALRVRSNTLVGKTSSENDVDLMTESLAIARARRSNTVSTNSNPITGFRAAWKRMSGATWIAKPNS